MQRRGDGLRCVAIPIVVVAYFHSLILLQLTINISRLRTFTLIVQISKRKAIERENCEIFDNAPQFLKLLFVIDLKNIENYDDLYFNDNSRLGLASFFNSLLGVRTLYKCSSHVNNIT